MRMLRQMIVKKKRHGIVRDVLFRSLYLRIEFYYFTASISSIPAIASSIAVVIDFGLSIG